MITEKHTKKKQYDVAIIGGGISGLTCGCYLAKAGFKVLILEKDHNAGGYCTSFRRKEFTFDAGIHGIGGLHPEGSTYKLLKDLSLSIDFEEKDPAESIYFENKYFLNFWKDSKKTESEFISFFPKEKRNIINFNKFVLGSTSTELYFRYKNHSFFDVLTDFFSDQKLRNILGIPLGNIGIYSKYCSAQAGITFYREFLLNTHRYPVGGMKNFSNNLKSRFLSLGGNLILNFNVVRVVKAGTMRVEILSKNDSFKSKILVLTCDLIQGSKIINDRTLSNQLNAIAKPLKVSPSAFFLNIGLSKNFSYIENGVKINNLWFFPTNDTKYVFLNSNGFSSKSFLKSKSIFISFVLPNSIRLLALAPFINNDFWDNNKQIIFDNLIDRANPIINDLRKMINISSLSTPVDLYRYTSNLHGSCYGWAVSNELGPKFSKFIKLGNNIYCCGHWVPNLFGTGGVSSVIHSGFLCSQNIIKRS